jgi:hypothetical protein
MNSKALNTKQEEWIRWHEHLNHISYSQIRRLAYKKILPHSLLSIKSFPLYPSCAFGGSKYNVWRTKDGYGSIKKEYHNQPGSLICIDQLVSAQPGLVSQLTSYLMASRI